MNSLQPAADSFKKKDFSERKNYYFLALPLLAYESFHRTSTMASMYLNLIFRVDHPSITNPDLARARFY